MRRYLITVLFAAALVLAFRYLQESGIAYAVILVLVCAPLMARLCAPIFMDMVSQFIGFSERSARGAWQGKYYSFDEQRIRFYTFHESIWIAESDVAGILGQALTERERRQLGDEYGVIPGKRLRGFTEEGLKRLLATRLGDRHATRQMVRFNHWLQSEAFPNVRRLPSSGI